MIQTLLLLVVTTTVTLTKTMTVRVTARMTADTNTTVVKGNSSHDDANWYTDIHHINHKKNENTNNNNNKTRIRITRSRRRRRRTTTTTTNKTVACQTIIVASITQTQQKGRQQRNLPTALTAGSETKRNTSGAVLQDWLLLQRPESKVLHANQARISGRSAGQTSSQQVMAIASTAQGKPWPASRPLKRMRPCETSLPSLVAGGSNSTLGPLPLQTTPK